MALVMSHAQWQSHFSLSPFALPRKPDLRTLESASSCTPTIYDVAANAGKCTQWRQERGIEKDELLAVRPRARWASRDLISRFHVAMSADQHNYNLHTH
jgi:hypothetical protein